MYARLSDVGQGKRDKGARDSREQKPGHVDRNTRIIGLTIAGGLSTHRNDPRLNYPPSGGVLTSAIASVESSRERATAH